MGAPQLGHFMEVTPEGAMTDPFLIELAEEAEGAPDAPADCDAEELPLPAARLILFPHL
jgi:hypothetical protein